MILNSKSFIGTIIVPPIENDGPTEIHKGTVNFLTLLDHIRDLTKKCNKVEDVVLHGCHHHNQQDVAALLPFESELEELIKHKKLPRSNCHEIL
jgi:hypothetical protein